MKLDELKSELSHQICNGPDNECTHCIAISQAVDYLAKNGYLAIAGKPKDGGDLVHTVYVVEDDFTHIFSTEKLAKDFADTKECPCVISTYLIDNPERFYEAVQ